METTWISERFMRNMNAYARIAAKDFDFALAELCFYEMFPSRTVCAFKE